MARIGNMILLIGNFVFVLQPPYQQQFYTSIIQAWPTGAPYYDINSVFQANGLAPQAFKTQSYRPNQRSRKQNRSSSLQSDSGSQVSICEGFIPLPTRNLLLHIRCAF